MGAFTAIEIGSDTCTMIVARAARGGVRIDRLETLDPASFPTTEAFASALGQARRRQKLPRRARAVLWGMPAAASPRDPAVVARLAALTSAGFRLDRVMRPADALLALSTLQSPPLDGSGAAWLAIDRASIAVAVTRAGALLYSRERVWDVHLGEIGSQAQLLQRYSRVAWLASELRQAMASARDRGVHVGSIVTCGNLGDLRSLTMPLIEEMDIEVETLDSLQGLDLHGAAREQMTDLAPAIRLAAATASARAAPARLDRRVAALGAAAVVIAAVGLGYVWYGRRAASRPAAAPTVAQSPARPAASSPPPSTPDASPAATTGSVVATPTSSVSVPRVPALPPPTAASTPASKEAVAPSTAGPSRGERLRDPVPRINTILVSEERRVALVDGRFVTIGEAVGHRIVARIEPRFVVFREPSGIQIRVGLGGRLLGVVGRKR